MCPIIILVFDVTNYEFHCPPLVSLNFFCMCLICSCPANLPRRVLLPTPLPPKTSLLLAKDSLSLPKLVFPFSISPFPTSSKLALPYLFPPPPKGLSLPPRSTLMTTSIFTSGRYLRQLDLTFRAFRYLRSASHRLNIFIFLFEESHFCTFHVPHAAYQLLCLYYTNSNLLFCSNFIIWNLRMLIYIMRHLIKLTCTLTYPSLNASGLMRLLK